MKSWQEYYDEGILLKFQGNFKKSAEYHLKVLELAPDLNIPEAWHNAGAALLRINEVEKAIPYLEKSLGMYDLFINGGHDKAYYIFWKSCVFALLNRKDEMLTTLETCLTEDKFYAEEAQAEEDFEAYFKDEDFKELIAPFIERIEQLRFRGKSLNIRDCTSEQRGWRKNFMEILENDDWDNDATFTDGFETISISPQAMYQYLDNRFFHLRLSLHLDTNLVFFELWTNAGADTELFSQFRLYYDNRNMLDGLSNSLKIIIQQKDSLDPDNFPLFVSKLIPTCKSMQFEDRNGRRHLLGVSGLN